MDVEIVLRHTRGGHFDFVVFVTFDDIDGRRRNIGFYHPVVIKEIIKDTR